MFGKLFHIHTKALDNTDSVNKQKTPELEKPEINGSLNLSGKKPENWHDIYYILSDNKNIKSANLSNCGITDDQLAKLLEAVNKNKVLQYLNISNNQITGKSVKNIQNFLINNNTLLTLDISGNNLSSNNIMAGSAACSLERAFRNLGNNKPYNSTLTDLKIDFCFVQSDIDILRKSENTILSGKMPLAAMNKTKNIISVSNTTKGAETLNKGADSITGDNQNIITTKRQRQFKRYSNIIDNECEDKNKRYYTERRSTIVTTFETSEDGSGSSPVKEKKRTKTIDFVDAKKDLLEYQKRLEERRMRDREKAANKERRNSISDLGKSEKDTEKSPSYLLRLTSVSVSRRNSATSNSGPCESTGPFSNSLSRKNSTNNGSVVKNKKKFHITTNGGAIHPQQSAESNDTNHNSNMQKLLSEEPGRDITR